MSQFFPTHALALVVIAACAFAVALLGFATVSRSGFNRVLRYVFAAICIVFFAVLLAGCGDTINPVRYQPVEVLVTKPCFAGRNPPVEAVTLTQEQCTAAGQCVRICTDPKPEVCVTHAVADITELQREARQYRNLFKECSK